MVLYLIIFVILYALTGWWWLLYVGFVTYGLLRVPTIRHKVLAKLLDWLF